MEDFRRVRLRDGRLVDVRVSGPPGGLPLVYHHGTPGARTPIGTLERAAHARGLRVVSLSRPGYGGSTRDPGRDVAAVADDVATVLASIGADRCLVAGWSGGGPHALACGALLDAAAAVLVIAGVAPFDAPGLDWTAGMGADNLEEFSAALGGEDALVRYLAAQGEDLKQVRAGDLAAALSSLLCDADRTVLTGEVAEDLAASFREGLGSGIEGWVDDDLALTRPWGFDLAEVRRPVALWQGSADLMVPFTHGEWLAARLSGASVHLEPGEGHLSIGFSAPGRMLDELVELAR